MRFLFISLTFFHLLKASSFLTHDVFSVLTLPLFFVDWCQLRSLQCFHFLNCSSFLLLCLLFTAVAYQLLLIADNYWLLMILLLAGPSSIFSLFKLLFFVILASNQVQVVFSLFDFVFQIKFEEKLNQDFQQLVCRDVCYLNSVVWLRRAIGIMIALHTGGNWLECEIQT